MIEFDVVNDSCRSVDCGKTILATARPIELQEVAKNASTKEHILRGLMSSHSSQLALKGEVLTPTKGSAFITGEAFYLRNCYDIFHNANTALLQSYNTQELMNEKRRKYGGFHNFYFTDKKRLNGKLLIEEKRFSGIDEKQEQDRLYFPIIWHDDHRNYWHWHFEILPRLLILRELCDCKAINHNTISYVVVGQKLSQYQYASASLALGKWFKYERADKGFKILQSLIVHAPFPATFSKEIIKELKRSLTITLEFREESKISRYINRSMGKNSRRILNLSEVTETLEDVGFEYHPDLASASYLYQQRLFASSSDVVLPHGAALTNMLFCDKKTKIIELFSEAYIHSETAIIACLLDLDYQYLYGSAAEPENIYSDYRVATKSIRSLLKA